MCKLWSGRLQQMQFLQSYEYYLRMDDDSLLTEPFAYDPFLKMRQRSLLYAYRRAAHDTWGIEQLWNIARPHVAAQFDKLYGNTNNLTSSNNSDSSQMAYSPEDLPFVSVDGISEDNGFFDGHDDDEVAGVSADKDTKATLELASEDDRSSAGVGSRRLDSSAGSSTLNGIEYYGAQPYNNFHISKVSFWNAPSWKSLYEDLNSQHAFYKYRVGDANVHAIALMMMPFGAYEQWQHGVDHVPYVHNNNDMSSGWAPKDWKIECEQAYSRFNISRKGKIRINISNSTKVIARNKITERATI